MTARVSWCQDMSLERVLCGALGNLYDSSRVLVSGHVAGTSGVWCSIGNLDDSSRVLVSGHVAGTSGVWCSRKS